ncbi:MAG: ribosome silencing factor [Verrucomicrobia bacterium]|nr:ribosome silencing factor [Verrucomicrobiota bacterium]
MLESTELAKIIADGLADKKGSDITIYDVRTHSDITDFHVLATGLNPPHLKALFNETRLRMKAHDLACYRKSGMPDSGWIVDDYIDVVLHLFNPAARQYYALDVLWKEMPRLAIGHQMSDAGRLTPD